MAEQLFFSRHTKVYMKQAGNVWELPVLAGFSFSQAVNSSEVTLQEMSATGGVSRRGKQMFNDSVAPAEWSFSTYARPFISDSAAVSGWSAAQDNYHHACEEALWANFVAPQNEGASSGYDPTDSTWDMGVSGTTAYRTFNFLDSNKSTLGMFDLYFQLGGCDSSVAPEDKLWYKIEGCVINSATINFEIDGIATIEWSGMGNSIAEEVSPPTVTIAEALTSTKNFIRNRLTTLAISGYGNSDTNLNIAYNAVLTGGSISFENNISFLTPENLCMVNSPIGHVTGNRNISGSFTAYLNTDTASTAELFDDLVNAKTQTSNSFRLVFGVGGSSDPRVEITLPKCHLEIPTHNIDDVIAVEVNFSALPSTISAADEAEIKYVGVAY